MNKKIKRRPKNEDMFKLSGEMLNLFRKKGGVYGVAMRNNLHGTNLYSKINRCDNALWRIRALLWLVNHDLEYKIVERKNGTLKK